MTMNTINRLQFRHHSEIFDTRELAVEYIKSQIRFTEEGLAAEDPKYGFSLLAEPTVLLYKNEEDETDPHLMLVVGSATNDGTQYSDNRFCIIDIDKTESEIEDLWEELEKIVRSLSLVTRDTNTLKLYAEKTDDGTVLSGDVQVAEAHIFDNVRLPNRIMATEDGLYLYVNLTYDEERDTFTFVVNNAETGELEKTSIKLPNNYLVGGEYSVEDESLHLFMKEGNEIVIDLENLIDEWDVEGEASKTPIVLTKEEVGYGDDANHNHVEPWQDVLRADVRLANMSHNILKKTSDGRYLYVNGMADNIAYFKDGVEITVADALNECAKKKVSSDNSNIIYEKPDGIFATATLKYISRENTLVFTASNVTGGTSTETIKLNTVEMFKEIYYDSVTEELVILYVNDTGDTVSVRIPIGEWMSTWEWDIDNDGHNVKLHKQRVIAGNDKVSADVDIFEGHDNILEDLNHQLYVRGTADNIKYGDDSTVKAELDKLIASDADINSRLNETSGKVDSVRADLDAEIARSTSEDERIEKKLDDEITRSTEKDRGHDTEINNINTTIGTGFTTDAHETVTYKFNQLSAKTDIISGKTDTVAANLAILSAKTEAEIQRATSEEQRIEKKFDDALGEGFDIRNTVRDEFDREKAEREAADNFLSGAIDTLSASSEGKLVDVVNVDHSINVDKTDPIRPVVGVNLSSEVEDDKPNIIKLNSDGLYAGVDLIYEFSEETGSNQLIFKTTNGTKVYDLKTNSVVDKIYYDPTREAIIIEYTVNGHRMPDVVIPVGDLINEWRVSDDTNGAIKLSKVRESGATQDVLYAESIISDHDDNILVNDNGALYVSSAPIDSLRADLDAEIARSTSEDERIENKLDDEIIRSTERDEALGRAISAETIARMSADTALQTAINEEKSDRVAADAEIRNDFNAALEAERTAREAADVALQTAINNEAIYRANADTELRNYIDSAITAEATARESADMTIQTALDAEIARSTSKDEEHDTNISELRSDLTNEITDRTNADNELRTLIHNEEDRAKSAETAITHSLEIERLERISSDSTLNQKIETEASNRISADNQLQTNIDNEASTRLSEDSRIESKLDAEIARSTAKDEDLQNKLNAEISARTVGDSDLRISISNEVARAQGAENAIGIQLSAETAARQAEDEHIWRVIRPIEFYDTTTIHNERVRNDGSNPDEVRHSVILSQANNNILAASDNLGGLYATAKLGYNQSANLLTIYGPDDQILNSVTLGLGSLIKDISYDYTEKDLVLTYRRAGDEEDTIMKFPVADLFNEWDIQNPSEGSALELHKINQTTETGTVDILWGRVLLTGAVERPDGTIDYGDNAIRIVNNGLYVSGSATTEVKQEIECLKTEVRTIETAILGESIVDSEDCGSGYTYLPNENACIISAATSMNDADVLLDRAICELTGVLEGSNTPSASIGITPSGGENVLAVDVRLSHGDSNTMEDEDLLIMSNPSSEFSDTNVLRLSVVGNENDSTYNGLFLSNNWNCGEYTEDGIGTPGEKYKIDDSSSAQNLFNQRYRNNVRA